MPSHDQSNLRCPGCGEPIAVAQWDDYANYQVIVSMRCHGRRYDQAVAREEFMTFRGDQYILQQIEERGMQKLVAECPFRMPIPFDQVVSIPDPTGQYTARSYAPWPQPPPPPPPPPLSKFGKPTARKIIK